MIHKQIGIEQVSSFVYKLFIEQQNQVPFLIYHNLLHTKKVVVRTNEIATAYNLDSKGIFVVTAAAWFHDCGHLFGPSIDHELRSVLKMKEFMEGTGMDELSIQQIESCILSTKFPGNPKNILEEILCDADLYHLGTTEFYISDMLVKREYELRNNFSPRGWDENSLALLESHKFFTAYCRNLLDRGKQENIKLIREKIKCKKK